MMVDPAASGRAATRLQDKALTAGDRCPRHGRRGLTPGPRWATRDGHLRLRVNRTRAEATGVVHVRGPKSRTFQPTLLGSHNSGLLGFFNRPCVRLETAPHMMAVAGWLAMKQNQTEGSHSCVPDDCNNEAGQNLDSSEKIQSMSDDGADWWGTLQRTSIDLNGARNSLLRPLEHIGVNLVNAWDLGDLVEDLKFQTQCTVEDAGQSNDEIFFY